MKVTAYDESGRQTMQRELASPVDAANLAVKWRCDGAYIVQIYPAVSPKVAAIAAQQLAAHFRR